MVQLYAFLSLAIPQELLGMLPHQYSLIALKPSLQADYFLRSQYFTGVSLPLDYSAFDEHITS